MSEHHSKNGNHWIGIKMAMMIIVILISIKAIVNGVIVDGDKKEDISPVKHQKHNATKMIDQYNVKTCGISDPDFGEHEFVNMARAGQFPWIVSFQIAASSADADKKNHSRGSNVESSKKKSVEDLHFCCGTFISSKWVLSAAHCFATDSIKKYLNSDKLKIVCGSHKVSSQAKENLNVTIKSIYYHKRFNKEIPIGFDIALVELDKPVKFAQKRNDNYNEHKLPFVNAACLPRKDHKHQFNESARIAGWGLSNPKDPSSMPSKLLTTDILLAKSKECADIYSKVLKSEKPNEQFKKYDDFICASYATTRDACQSDSGGPLMQYVDGKAVVVGIVSYGIGCAKEGVPGLYTRTSGYINWIKDITEHGEEASVEFTLMKPTKNQNSAHKTTSTSTTKSPKPTTSKNPSTTSKSQSTTSKPTRAKSTRTTTTQRSTTQKVTSRTTKSSSDTTHDDNFEFAE